MCGRLVALPTTTGREAIIDAAIQLAIVAVLAILGFALLGFVVTLKAVFGKKKIDAVRIYVLGIKKKYQRWPLGAPLYSAIWDYVVQTGRKGLDI